MDSARVDDWATTRQCSGVMACHTTDSSNAETETEVSVLAGAPLEVRCALRLHERVEWRLNGTPVELTAIARGEEQRGERVWAWLRMPHATSAHAGRYTCSATTAATSIGHNYVVRVHVLPATATAAAAGTLAASTAPRSAAAFVTTSTRSV